jgi:cholesterol oxidase
MTGPIISRPTKAANKFQLRIWAETNEFQTSPTRIVEYEYSQSPRAILTPIRWIRGADVGDKQLSNVPGNTNTLLNSVFWLGDFEVGPKTAGIKAVAVGSGGHLTSVGIKGSGLAFNKVSPFRSLQSIGSALPLPDITGSTPVPTAPQDSISDIAIDWTELPWFQRFMSESTVGGGSFVLGSCWYPGSWFDQDRADRIFAKIQDLVVHQPGIDHLLLVGDQIYADASYGILDLAENRERFQQSYRRAFESPWASWVFSHVPTYFAIDDHEFRDNYPTLRPGDCPQAMLELAQAGIQEAWNFQIHSDAAPPVPTNIHDNHLWYFFESGGFHFFVFDTRSERNTKETGLRSIISQTQEDAFVAWAASLSPDGRPALLVTGSPLAPVPSDEMLHSTRASTSDGLRAYPDFVELIGRIMRHRQKTLILLSGDPHFSSMCEFTLSGLATQWSMPCISIISSGVNVPLPFANDLADDYTWNIPQPTFQPYPPAVALNIGCSTILSNSRSHVLRVALTQAADSSWSLSVAAIEADAVVQPQPVVRNLPV